ncbi:RRQRL motif-containing zinc-binding protein [Saccharothrix xinjiangensis]|uniref:RRQRL motif-containing zinc-binding protein n=1 Tax=Saccharothrix xinjiangensis TaxID=204798 RepID=A0ABV9XS52_9PSEU
MVRRFSWVWVESVPWATGRQLVRGTHDGLPLLTWGRAPREKLATRRQLRARGLRPGGADPVAVLYVKHRASGRRNFANLYLVSAAKPVRPMTPAKQAALDKANRARARRVAQRRWSAAYAA